MPRRIPTTSLRPGDRIRVEEILPGEGWHPARRVRTSTPGVVSAIRDLGPAVTRRFRVTVRLDDGRLVTFHCRAQATQMIEEA